MKYVFLGSPQFAAIILSKLINAGMVPSSLVCNSDRPVGRKKIITSPPTKDIVNGLGVNVFQPETKGELSNFKKEIFRDVDFGIVAAYSQIIPVDVIEESKLGIIGVHPSLLPKHRGASPIQSAILNGDIETGTTLFFVDKGVDSGRILVSRKLDLNVENYYYEELLVKLADLSSDLLVETMPRFARGEIDSYTQDELGATYTNKFFSEDGYIDPNDLHEAKNGNREKAVEIYRKIRALNPEPGVYTILNEKRVKLLRGELRGDKLVLTRVQREGKKPIEV